MSVKHIPTYQFGEKGHLEYGWSDNCREKLVQWNFQAIRCNDDKMDQLENIYYQLIKELYTKYKFSCIVFSDKQIALDMVILLYKMIGQIRDLVEGKGEYSISYRMIYSWYLLCPELSYFALESFVKSNDNEHPFGSWKDIKYFCNFLMKKGLSKQHDLINFSIQLMNKQLREDEEKIKNNNTFISLVAKWIPREKSEKFGWINELLAMDFFSFYLKNVNQHNKIQLEKAINKCKMDYRKLISNLNKICETTEIKQCSKDWSNIDFQKVTSIGLWKKSASFLNSRNKKEEDRKICLTNFQHFIGLNKGNLKGENIELGEFTKRAIYLIHQMDMDPTNEKIIFQMKILDEQWINNSKKIENLNKMIPIVDISDTMSEEAKNLALAIGIRIAEKSIFAKKRIIILGSYSKWVNLESCTNFTSMIKMILNKNNCSINANLYSSIDMILKAMINVKMTPLQIQDLMLVIISDMQVDSFKENTNNLFWEIQQKYHSFGSIYYGMKINPPPILLWNVRNTNGFPVTSSQENCFMLSGNHTFLLNLYSESGNKISFYKSTPWSKLIKSLDNKRYKVLEKKGLELM